MPLFPPGPYIAASNTTYAYGLVQLSGGANITVGTNANTITFSGGAGGGGSVNFSAGTTSNNLTNIVFSNGSGVTFGLNGSTITASVAAVGGAQTGISGIANSQTTYTSGTVSLSDQANITIASSVNGATQIYKFSVAAQTNQQMTMFATSNTTQSSTGTTNASSIIFAGAGAVSVGITGGSVVVSAPNTVAQTVQTGGIYVTAQSTGQSSSSTYDLRTLSFVPDGIISAGWSNGSFRVSATQSNQAFTAAGGSSAFQTLAFGDTNQVSWTNTNGSVGIASIKLSMFAVSNTTQSSNGTANHTALSFGGAGAVSVGITGGSVVVSAPNTIAQTNQQMTLFATSNTTQSSTGTTNASSIIFAGAGGASVGITNGSIVVSTPPRLVSQLLWPPDPWRTNFTISNATMSLQHFNPKADITASQANMLLALSGNTNSSGALTISLGIYTMAGSTMSLASSSSVQHSWTSGSQTSASSLYGGQSGTQYRSIGLGNWSITGGDYVLAVWYRTTNDGTWRAFGVQGPTIVNALDANQTKHYFHGVSASSYTTAMLASINVTDTNYVRTGGDALKQPGLILLGSY